MIPSYFVINSNNMPYYMVNENIIPYIQPIKSNEYRISVRYGILDTENYFTDWEMEQIKESLSDYDSGNYITGSIDDILKYLHS